MAIFLRFGIFRKIEKWEAVREEHKGSTRVAGVPSTLMEFSCPSRTASNFSIFLNIPKWRKHAISTVLESVYLPYHIPIPFRSLKHSGKCSLCIPPGYDFNNISFNIYRITWDIMFDSLTVHHLWICAFEVVDFYGSGMIDLLDNIRTFPFREKFSCKKS